MNNNEDKIKEVIRLFREKFVRQETNSQTGVWWKIPPMGGKEIASPIEVEKFLIKELSTLVREECRKAFEEGASIMDGVARKEAKLKGGEGK